MSDHRERRESLGAYVLGALEPDERRLVEVHLEACAACRDELARLSALPPLLDHLTADEAADASLLPPSSLLTRVNDATLHEGRRLRRELLIWRAATGAAAAVTVGVLLAWSPWSTPTLDRWVLEPVATTGGVGGTAAALDWEWGTTVELQLQDLPPAERYVVWAIAGDGHREQAGTWGPTESGRATVRGASAIKRHELAQIEVALATGPVLATFDVAPPG